MVLDPTDIARNVKPGSSARAVELPTPPCHGSTHQMAARLELVGMVETVVALVMATAVLAMEELVLAMAGSRGIGKCSHHHSLGMQRGQGNTVELQNMDCSTAHDCMDSSHLKVLAKAHHSKPPSIYCRHCGRTWCRRASTNNRTAQRLRP